MELKSIFLLLQVVSELNGKNVDDVIAQGEFINNRELNLSVVGGAY